MISTVLGALRWCVSLAAKFGRVVFWRTSLIVLVTLVSQISTVLASFLPLKVVILLGSNGMPRYIPDVLAAQGRESLIVLLSAATVGFFLLHLLAEQLIAVITTQATRRLLAKSHKMVLFENQDEIAANAYQRFSLALAGVVFTVLALTGLFLLYSDMAWALTGYVMLAAIVLCVLGARSTSSRECLESQLPRTMKLTSGIGFFAAFAYLVVDFILLEPPGVLIAIVSLLWGRQVFDRLATVVQNIAALYKHRVKIDALFFHGKVLLPLTRENRTIWPLLDPEIRGKWIATVLEELIPEWKGCKHIHIEWYPSGTPNVAAFMVTEKLSSAHFLVKLFGVNRKSVALHESTLLSDAPKGLPAPVFWGGTQVERFVCSVYRVPDGAPVVQGKDSRHLARQLRTRLLAVEPPEAMVHRYLRSRPLLWQRIQPSFLKRLYVAVVSAEQKQQVSRLLELLPELQYHLKSLPLAIVNPALGSGRVWSEAQTGESIAFNWGRWTLEPVGAKWPVGTEVRKSGGELERLEKQLKAAAEMRPALIEVRVEQAKLAALASALEERCQRQQISDGLELVGRILDCLEALTEVQPAVNRLPA